MIRKRALAPLIISALCLTAALASTASGATTFGATLTGTPTLEATNCKVVTLNVPVSCTLLISRLDDPADRASTGLTSPTAGVIVRWRVVAGASTATSLTFTPRVIELTNLFTALRSGTPHSIPASGGTFEFPDRLPIPKDGWFAFDSVANGPVGAGPIVAATSTQPAAFIQKAPAVPDGGTFSVGISIGTPMNKLLVNADVEPDVDGDGFGDETQDLCTSRADVQSVCPPPKISTPTLSKGVFGFTSDIAAKATTTLFKVSNGRKVGKKCKSKAKKGKKCKIYTKFAEWDDNVVAGANKISYAYKVGGKSLKKGSYRATIVVTSPQNTVTTKTIDFKIKK
jgi:hypothetical protein